MARDEILKEFERKRGVSKSIFVIKKGRWMSSAEGAICSNCYQKLGVTGLLSTCPNCYADMREER